MLRIDKNLDRLEKEVYDMGLAVMKQHERCVQIFRSNDHDLARDIIETDRDINNLESKINDMAIADFTRLSPVATDLRRVIVAIKIASDLERIGDYAKNLAKFIIKHDYENTKDILSHAIVMEENFVHMLGDVMECYKDKDLNRAYDIPKQDDILNGLLKEFRYRITDEEKIDLEHVFYLTGVFRNIERSGDHSVNICEHIVYLCKGVQYDFDNN